MTSGWKTKPVADLEPGDRVRHPAGVELTVTRIEPGFLGSAERVGLIEDTPERWLKAPVAADGEIEVWAEG